MTLEPRPSITEVDPTAYEAVLGLERYVRASKLEPTLLDLVKIRASQINGCAFCLDMHSSEARQHGEAQRRLDVLSGWHEVPAMFTEREQAALALTEAVTRIADNGVPNGIWDSVGRQFTDQETVHLLMAVATINVWNRLAVSTHQQPPDTT